MSAVFLLLAAIALPPKPDHYVTDRAGVLRNAGALNEKLASFERQTSDQILVYVEQHLPPDTSIEEMGSEAMRQWGVGQKGKDNGAILFVFTGDRKMRIEVGYGLEASLTDAKSKWITSTVIKPQFQRGDYDAGINRGVDAMLAAARGEVYRGTGRTVADAGLSRTDRFLAAIPMKVLGPILIILLFSFPIVIIIIATRAKVGSVPAGGGRDDWQPSSFDDSSSSSPSFSSSDSSSSFSGGGGSGGGGGASDSW